MKLLRPILFTLFISILSYSNAQINSSNLDHNNVSANISDAGTFFYDFTNQKLGYEIPKESGRHAIYSTQFWFAAKNAQGEILFTQGGEPNVGSDVFNGPISDSTIYATAEYQNKWEKSIWNICQTDIDNFKLTYECNLDPNCNEIYPLTNEAIQTINNWPAHGDNNSGQSFYLAPFFDYNSDGVYDPAAGDYPIIKGCCATYMIQNDAAETHSYTNTDAIGIEIHTMFYQYKTWDYLNDATFVDIIAINKSATDYPEFIHSIAVDADIGNYNDDYFGTDSLNNLTYFYNSDNDDENFQQTFGYGINPPAIGIVNLNNDMTSSVPFTNTGLTVSNKWNLMNGLKADGSSCLDPDSLSTKYVFSGNPNNPAEWSAMSVGHPINDAKALSSVKIGSFNIGDTLEQSYAITYSRNGNHLENVQSIIDLTSEVKLFYDNESNIPCTNGTTNTKEQENLFVTISPNPSSGIVHVNNNNKNPLSISVIDLQGKLIFEKSFTSEGNYEIDLSAQRSGIYIFHLKTKKESFVKKVVIQ